MQKFIHKILGIDSDFKRIFYTNEFETLRGKSSRGIYALSLIMFFTFISLSFAIGGQRYLKKRMDNPFTNWVNLRMDRQVENKQEGLLQSLEPQEVRDQFNLKEIKDYRQYDAPFVSIENKTINCKGRTVDYNTQLVDEVVSGTNECHTYDIAHFREDEREIALVVTEDMIKKLGYTGHPKRLIVSLDGEYILVPILSVVKALPNLREFMGPQEFYEIFRAQFNRNGRVNNIRVFNSLPEKEFLEIVSKNETFYRLKTEEAEFTRNNPLYIHTLTLENYMDSIGIKEFIASINVGNDSRTKRHFHPTDLSTEKKRYMPTDLAFIFENTKKVRSFGDTLNAYHGVSIDMSQIESKENFALVSQLTKFISFALFVLSLLSIVFFIDSILKTHLEKSKTNLGTFKAFGLNNNFLTGIYLKIILNFLLVAMALALATCGIIIAIEQVMNGTESLLNLFNMRIMMAVVALLVFVFFYSKRTINKILKHTPGDLIYRRV